MPAADEIKLLSTAQIPADVDLTRMAEWALNYLTETPRKNLGYEPVFQCHPLQCPPVPEGEDPVVACDTDARMDWEWYYMRDITGSNKGAEVEAAFHQRIRQYIDPEGKVWSHPGCFNEGNINTKYEKKDFVIHIWGATKILQSLSEDYYADKESGVQGAGAQGHAGLEAHRHLGRARAMLDSLRHGCAETGWQRRAERLEPATRSDRGTAPDILAGDW